MGLFVPVYQGQNVIFGLAIGIGRRLQIRKIPRQRFGLAPLSHRIRAKLMLAKPLPHQPDQNTRNQRQKDHGEKRQRDLVRNTQQRGRIIRDETLADLASHPPRSQADLAKVRGLSAAWKDNDIGKRMMKIIADAEPLPKSEMPEKMKRGAPLGKEGALVADLLKLLLKIRAREIDVAARLLTRADEMEALAAGVRDLKVLKGWRYEVFGKDALELVEGKTAFAVKHGKLTMTHIDDMQASMEDALAAE